jgi:hypothetical protein
MEKQPHSIITERMREFKKLRRQYRACERENRQMDIDLYNQMLQIDEWLADNCHEWVQNYPEAEQIT